MNNEQLLKSYDYDVITIDIEGYPIGYAVVDPIGGENGYCLKGDNKEEIMAEAVEFLKFTVWGL